MYRFTSTLLSPFVRYPRQLQLPVSLLTVFLWRSSVSRAALSETLRRPLFSSSPLSSPLSFPSPSIPSGIFEQVERKSYPSMSALETKEKEEEMENSQTTIPNNNNNSNNVSKETLHVEKEKETTTKPSDTIDTDSPTDKDVIDTHYIFLLHGWLGSPLEMSYLESALYNQLHNSYDASSNHHYNRTILL